MTKHKIVVKRNPLGQITAQNSIGINGRNAVSEIPGTTNVSIETEDAKQAEISYSYTLKEGFWDIETHLAKYGLEAVDLKPIASPKANSSST